MTIEGTDYNRCTLATISLPQTQIEGDALKPIDKCKIYVKYMLEAELSGLLIRLKGPLGKKWLLLFPSFTYSEDGRLTLFFILAVECVFSSV